MGRGFVRIRMEANGNRSHKESKGGEGRGEEGD